MLANWVKETTATTGAGAISLGGATAGHIAFSSAFVTGERVIYAIEDGNNREIGIGTLTSGSPWTLARTNVFETLVAGVYSNTAPPPITLSGAATVGVAAASQNLMSRLLAAPVYPGGVWLPPNIAQHNKGTGKGGGEYSASAGRITLLPVTFRNPVRIAEIGAEITVISAGGNFRVGLYASLHTGAPGALLADSGNLSTGATGLVMGTLAQPLYLPAGRYYTANAVDNVTALARGVSTEVAIQADNFYGQSGTSILQQPQYQQAFGAFPAIWPGASNHTYYASFGVIFR